jgi:serine-type D-Ala-D-Ala carboxypeptidase/endopeptidase
MVARTRKKEQVLVTRTSILRATVFLAALLALLLPDVFPGLLSAVLGREARAQRLHHFPSAEDLVTFARAQVEQRHVAGMVIGVLEADGSTRITAAGSSGPGARPLDSRSLFEIGSATKAFTGTLLADMVARKEVALDDPVSKYLPERVKVPSRGGRQITLLDLATHHSGLPRMPRDFTPADPQNPYADFTVEKMYAFISGYELPRDPGSRGEYSNLGMGLLGHALARRAGGSYEQVIRSRVLDPLGMRTTGVTLEGERRALMVKGHGRDGQLVPLYDAPAIQGAGSLKSNAEDLLKFVAANVGPPKTPLERALRASHTIQKRLSETLAIGLAWQTVARGAATIVGHGGGTGGFESFIGFDPEKRLGVVVLINNRTPDGTALQIGTYLLNPSAFPLK